MSADDKPSRRGSTIHLCPIDDPATYRVPHPDCPNVSNHIPEPEGYMAWHHWGAAEVQDPSPIALRGLRTLRDLGAAVALPGW